VLLQGEPGNKQLGQPESRLLHMQARLHAWPWALLRVLPQACWPPWRSKHPVAIDATQ
jgi:hypothetical protein